MAQKDNFEALEELLKRIQKDIFSVYSHICKKREIASDLTQEALVKIARNLEKLHDTKYYIIDKESPEIIVKNENLEIKDTTQTEPMEKCLASELGCIIKNCILSLPINSRVAIVLREFEGMSYNDIAHITHTSVGTVKSRISRARVRLQEELGNYL